MSQGATFKAAVAEASKSLGFPFEPVETKAELIPEEEFRRMLVRERKRSERLGTHLLLMLVDGKSISKDGDRATLGTAMSVLPGAIRDTDVAGWFETGAILGVVFTELGQTDAAVAVKVIENKIRATLQKTLKPGALSRLLVSFFAYPDDWGGKNSPCSLDPALYPDLFELVSKRRMSLLPKRSMEIVGSPLAALAPRLHSTTRTT